MRPKIVCQLLKWLVINTSFFGGNLFLFYFFLQCSEKGCDVIEFDVTLTKDEVPIVFHDDSLQRMTDLNLVISREKWADLSHIDISVKHVYK